MYGTAGERRLDEYEVDWLPGYERSAPVRVGNAAHGQYQLDVYGEVLDSLHQTRLMGIEEDPNVWSVQRAILEFLESGWRDPDEGIWEVRGGRRDFVHSKVMAWVAFDRAVKGVGAVRARGTGRPLARVPRRDAPRGARAGLRRRAQHLHAVLRLGRRSTRAP